MPTNETSGGAACTVLSCGVTYVLVFTLSAVDLYLICDITTETIVEHAWLMNPLAPPFPLNFVLSAVSRRISV